MFTFSRTSTLTKVIKTIEATDVLGEGKSFTFHPLRTLIARVWLFRAKGVWDGQVIEGSLAVKMGREPLFTLLINYITRNTTAKIIYLDLL